MRSSRKTVSLAYLTAFFATSHIDRHIIAIVLPAIGLEMGLNDIQLGILSGIAFSLVFAIGAIPLGMVTAFVDRRHVIAVSILLWSVMTLLSGFAAGFLSLLFARIGVGLAEAAGVPAAHRVISESYGDTQRVKAFSIFNAGSNIGIALALVGGGLLVQTHGWRAAMIVAGLPGIVLAVLTYACIDRSTPLPGERMAQNSRMLLREARVAILSNPTKRLTFFGAVLTSIIGLGMLAWLPSFLIRVHDMPARQVGIFLALVLGVMGAIGTVGGGHLVSRLSRSDPALMLWIPMGILMVGKPMILAALLVDSTSLSLALLVFPLMFGTLHLVISLSVLHEGLDGRMRQMASAFLLACGNLIGYSLGPLIVGAGSWAMSGIVPGEERLGYAMILLQGCSVFGLYAYWRAGHAYRNSKGYTKGMTSSPSSPPSLSER